MLSKDDLLPGVIADLEAACKRARERVNRAIGQHVRYAKEALAKRIQQARDEIGRL